MGTKKMRTEDRREQILDAALEIAGRNGLQAMNIGDIAERIGLVPSAVYRHFDGREDLVDALIERTGSRILENIRLVSRHKEDILHQLGCLFRLHLHLIRTNPAVMQIIFSDEVAFGGEKRQGLIRRITSQYRNELASLVEKGKEAGAVKPFIDPFGAAFSMISLLQGVGTALKMEGSRKEIFAMAASAWYIFESGIAMYQSSVRRKIL